MRRISKIPERKTNNDLLAVNRIAIPASPRDCPLLTPVEQERLERQIAAIDGVSPADAHRQIAQFIALTATELSPTPLHRPTLSSVVADLERILKTPDFVT